MADNTGSTRSKTGCEVTVEYMDDADSTALEQSKQLLISGFINQLTEKEKPSDFYST